MSTQSFVWAFASAFAAGILTYVYSAALGKANPVCAKSAFRVSTIVLLGNFIVNHIMAANRVGTGMTPVNSDFLKFHASDPF